MHSPTSYRSTRTARDAACHYVSINFACTVPTCSGAASFIVLAACPARSISNMYVEIGQGGPGGMSAPPMPGPMNNMGPGGMGGLSKIQKIGDFEFRPGNKRV